MNQVWDARRYAADFSYVADYGKGVADLLACPAGSFVVDLGCGTGSLTAALAGRGWRVLGLDASPEQLRAAREAHPELSFREADAADFTLGEAADAVFSNAVFHWISRERQPDLLASVYRALKPGGEFVFEMGGRGNNGRIFAELARQFEARGYRWALPFYFPGVGEYAPLVEAAGFTVRYAALIDRPTALTGPDGLRAWMDMFVKAPFADVPADAAEDIKRAVVERLRPRLFHDGVWYADYVRLRMKAVK